MYRQWKLILLFLLLSVNAFAGNTFQGTNYADDANCKVYYRFNGSANGSESNYCGGVATTPTVADATSSIGTSTTVPDEWVGQTRVLQFASSEYFWHADNLATDLYGDIDITWGGTFSMDSDTNDDMYLVSKYYPTDYYRQYALMYSNANDVFQCLVSDDGLVYETAFGTTNPAQDGTFYDVVCTYEDTVGIKVYVNGVDNTASGGDCSGGSTNCDSIYQGSAAFAIGARTDDGTTNKLRFLDGKFKEAWVMNRLLSDNEIKEISVYGFDGQRGHSD